MVVLGVGKLSWTAVGSVGLCGVGETAGYRWWLRWWWWWFRTTVRTLGHTVSDAAAAAAAGGGSVAMREG